MFKWIRYSVEVYGHGPVGVQCPTVRIMNKILTKYKNRYSFFFVVHSNCVKRKPEVELTTELPLFLKKTPSTIKTMMRNQIARIHILCTRMSHVYWLAFISISIISVLLQSLLTAKTIIIGLNTEEKIFHSIYRLDVLSKNTLKLWLWFQKFICFCFLFDILQSL